MSGRAVVAVVQTAQSCIGDQRAGRRRTDSASWRFLAQPKMSSVVMMVSDVLGQKPPEMALVPGEDVVQQLTSATAHPALGHSVLPGALHRGLQASDLQ